MSENEAAAEVAPRRVVLRGQVRVALPVERTLHLFTPAGERLWVDGWDPTFPAGEEGDGAAGGTAFLTHRDGKEAIWVVVERGEHVVRYARVTPGEWAGLVEVRCASGPDGSTTAEVTYDLTALEEAGHARLAELAAGYAAYLGQWESQIGEALAAGRLG